MDNTPTYGQQGGPPAPDGNPPPLPWQQGGQPAPWPPQGAPPQPFPPAQTAPPHAAPPVYPPQPYPPVHQAAVPPPSPVPGPPRFPPTPPRRRWVPVLAGALVILILVTGVVVAWQVMGDDDGAPTATPSATAVASLPAAPNGLTPTPGASADDLGDEFDGTALSEPKWGIYGSTSQNGSVWSRDAVTVQDGILRIAGTGRNPTGSGNVAGGVCWCGPGGNRTSGVWTVRARFDAGAGYGPGLMLWPESDEPSDGFATFAAVNDPARKTLRSLVMWGTAGARAEATLAGDFTRWHVYRVEWRAGSLKMFVDDQLLFDSATRAGMVVPTAPMHLVIQVVAGPKDGVPAANATTPDKVVTEVDWVRYSP